VELQGCAEIIARGAPPTTEHLLEAKGVGVIKWVKFGDECSKFFYAKATTKNKRNHMNALKTQRGYLSHLMKGRQL
jgi:hypothetical protein